MTQDPHHPAGVEHRPADDAESVRAARGWWDADADEYMAEHGGHLGGGSGGVELVWCPEGLTESDAQLLGPTAALAGSTVLEIGCGAAQGTRWLASVGAVAVGLDLSARMLAHSRRLDAATGVSAPVVQADSQRLPVADAGVDHVVSAFGALPFVADSALWWREVARVLRPGGRAVVATTHPMRWAFPDDPGPDGLTVRQSYFDRTPYVEVDGRGAASYVEHHRTVGDRVRDVVAAGLVVVDLLEPEWPAGFTGTWGQWSPLRGALFPGTMILVAARPA